MPFIFFCENTFVNRSFDKIKTPKLTLDLNNLRFILSLFVDLSKCKLLIQTYTCNTSTLNEPMKSKSWDNQPKFSANTLRWTNVLKESRFQLWDLPAECTAKSAVNCSHGFATKFWVRAVRKLCNAEHSKEYTKKL